jgi:hypothetical protein
MLAGLLFNSNSRTKGLQSLSRFYAVLPTAALFLLPANLDAQEGIPCIPEPTVMGISYGDLITCELGTAGDSDIFTFAGTVGDAIVAQVAETSGFGEPCLEIFRPDATTLASLFPVTNLIRSLL